MSAGLSTGIVGVSHLHAYRGTVMKDYTMERLGYTIRRFGPKKADHPSVGETCLLCEAELMPGDYTTLIAVGPAEGDETREEDGKSHDALAAEIHWTCASRLPVEAPGG